MDSNAKVLMRILIDDLHGGGLAGSTQPISQTRLSQLFHGCSVPSLSQFSADRTDDSYKVCVWRQETQSSTLSDLATCSSLL